MKSMGTGQKIAKGNEASRSKKSSDDQGSCWTYIVECRDGSLYTGWTTDLYNRIEKHNKGQGAKYTKSRRPVRLVYTKEHKTKREAIKQETFIKKMTRKQKFELISSK